MDRSTLTEQYLTRLCEQPTSAVELRGRQQDDTLLASHYRGGFLSRPLFLGHEERERLMADLETFRTALLSLPDRLFDGDLGAFARAVGLTEVQVRAILRSRGTGMTRMARADLCVDESGFKLLEANMTSALGGMDNGVMARALLEHPLLADFADRHRLGYVDTVSELLHTMYAETGLVPQSRPVIALADWPSSYQSGWGAFLEEFCAHLQSLGVDAHPCHIGQFDYRDGRVWLGDRAVDIIHRIFLVEDLLESPEAPALMDQVLDAASAGQVKLFVPLDAELFASKTALAMLSDEQNRHLFSAEELAGLDRILPWTRIVRPGKVTLETGEAVELIDYALAHRHDLVLKPTVLHGGSGVVLGWDESVTPESWAEHLDAALGSPYVLQRRIRPVTELFPDENGRLQPWVTVWGVFTMARGFAGVLARGTRADADTGVVNVANGAHAGTALYELPPARTCR
ncbi:hypothetical protein GCM10010211_75090 [Streptomyces albospinus]|uniref:Glutathionylspermidine synthase pre-ATP-grasp-like domain-containing protein n=1 Tax=Streptomyces albospinus TaxID=285515 RepID=A0ABQ2VLW5_9ACTN|nr:hypothetical protein [Streptomyces albospinus]GGU96737.1 hypothetical protein GCM10010211_75090 [Streptomyces albospinus]